MEITDAINRIDPNKVYNVSEMRRDNLFPWISNKTPSSYINAIHEDKADGNLMKSRITYSGRGRRYKIKGKNIINYLKSKTDNENTT